MNLAQQEKLHKLINTSSILNPQERTEWMGLLGLMNDKQLGELDRILTSAINHSVVAARPQPEPVKMPPAGAPTPQLSHIANLPRTNDLKPEEKHLQNLPKVVSKPASSLTHQGGPASSLTTSQGGPASDFAAHLKEMVNEKELTPGKSSIPAGLPQGVVRKPDNQPILKPAIQNTPPPSPAEIIKKIEEHKASLPASSPPFSPQISKQPEKVSFPVLTKPAPVSFAQKPPITLPPLTSTIKPITQVSTPPEVAKPAIQNFPIAPAIPKAPSKPLASSRPQNPLPNVFPMAATGATPNIDWKAKGSLAQTSGEKPVFTPTQTVSKVPSWVLEKPKPGSLASVEENLLEKKTLLHLQPQGTGVFNAAKPKELPPKQQPKAAMPVGSPAPKFENSADLILLSTKILQNSNFDSLLSGIRTLTARFGYHEVLFNIEKSPLYKSYIQTGKDLLSKQMSFEQLSATSSENYLSREAFEKLADLLTKIQTQ